MDVLFRLLQFGVFVLLVWGAYLAFAGRDRRKRERRRLSRSGDGGRRMADRWKDPQPAQKQSDAPAAHDIQDDSGVLAPPAY